MHLSGTAIKRYEAIYEHLHAHPELSNEEENTAPYLQQHLQRTAKFDFHTNIGGHGFVAVFNNGPGKTVLIRADIDALPLQEDTGLPFSSTARSAATDSTPSRPVMHACGHDLHMTCLLAAAEILTSTLRSSYTGTLILLFQPAEERGTGARDMVNDGLYDRISRPDFLLGQHVVASLPAGCVGLRAGTIMAGAESMRCNLVGLGGHASQPHRTIDPAVLASNVILRLQQIVSREVDPGDTAVVTALPLSASAAENIIPDSIELGVDIRAIEPATHARVRAAVERIVKAECDASGAQAPTLKTTRMFPATVNAMEMIKMISPAFESAFGANFRGDIPVTTIAEDFPNLAQGRPYLFWLVGAGDDQRYDLSGRRDSGKPPVAMNHSARFAPVLHPTLEVGVEALIVAALACFRNRFESHPRL